MPDLATIEVTVDELALSLDEVVGRVVASIGKPPADTSGTPTPDLPRRGPGAGRFRGYVAGCRGRIGITSANGRGDAARSEAA